jgi:hypothetical protein
MEWYIEQIFKGLPFGIAIAIVIFLGILLIIWLLLPSGFYSSSGTQARLRMRFEILPI